MKKSITVLGVESAGVRGIRLAQSGAEWHVADRRFWRIGGGATSAQTSETGTVDDERQPADIRYADTVEALKEAAKCFGTHEVVLSLPLSSMLMKVSRVPLEDRERLQDVADGEIAKISPFPDETPVVGAETVAETDREFVSMFAALPETGAADIGDALDEAKVRVLRTDVAALGWLRTLWTRMFPETDAPETSGEAGATASRKVVLMDCDGGGWDVVVLDSRSPSLLRSLGETADSAEISREVALSLLRAGASAEASEIVVFSKSDVDPELVERLGAFAPVRIERVGGVQTADDDGQQDDGGEAAYGGVEGIALRTVEGFSIDVTPADWTELRTEARFRKKLIVLLSVAAAGWALLMGALFGVPVVYGQMAERQKTLSKRHAAAFKEVKDMRDKVKLVQQYSDHARGSLELLKAVSDRLPDGVTLTSFNYRRGDKLSVSGEAQQPTDVYDFKNELTEAEADDGEKLFAEVNLSGPSQSRGVHKFSVECLFETGEDGK